MSDDVLLPAIERAVRRILKHPYGVVCKHWMIAALLSELEEAGYPQPDGFVRAVVRADDETALSFESIFEEADAHARR
jgi:hypothetical protein